MVRLSDVQRPYGPVLAKARELSQQVKETAERVHQQALEAHRLTAIAREQSERGRELSRKGREEARAVERSLRWSLDTANNAVHGLSRKDKG
jgi:methyl-accepting chemotaxis protein